MVARSGPGRSGAPRRASVGEPDGRHVWHVYDDLGAWGLDREDVDTSCLGGGHGPIADLHAAFAATLSRGTEVRRRRPRRLLLRQQRAGALVVARLGRPRCRCRPKRHRRETPWRVTSRTVAQPAEPRRSSSWGAGRSRDRRARRPDPRQRFRAARAGRARGTGAAGPTDRLGPRGRRRPGSTSPPVVIPQGPTGSRPRPVPDGRREIPVPARHRLGPPGRRWRRSARQPGHLDRHQHAKAGRGSPAPRTGAAPGAVAPGPRDSAPGVGVGAA